MYRLLFPAAAALLVASCATVRVEPVVTDGVTLKYDRGRAIPTYSDDATVMAVLSELGDGETMFKITLRNKAAQSWRVADTDFAVEASKDGQDWKPIRLYTSTEFYEREHSRYVNSVALAMNGAPDDSIVTTRTTRSWNGGVTVQETRIYHEPGVGSAWMAEDYALSGGKWLRTLEDNLFYVKDLSSQETYFGLVFSVKIDAPYYRITLKRDGQNSPSVQFQRIVSRA